MPADAGAGGTVASGVTAKAPESAERAGSVADPLGARESVLDQLLAVLGSGLGHPDGADSVTGEVGGTSRTGSEIGNAVEVGGTSFTGADTGIDGEPEARASRRLGTASAVGGTTKSLLGGSANGGGTGAEGAGIGTDAESDATRVASAADTGGGTAGAAGAEGFGCVWSVQASPSHQRIRAGSSESVYHPGATELISPPHDSAHSPTVGPV